MRLLVTLAAVFALASCGSMNETKKPAISEEAAIAKAAELPATVIVRVPVGTNGKELHDMAELRTTNDAGVNSSSVAAAFSSAKSPDAVVDELDKTSSTESTCGWRRWRRCASCGYAYTSYNYNWSFYTPAYYNYGYYYGYNYTNSYNYAGYNYYQYNSSFGSSYSGYGNAPGYGYAY